MSRILSIFNILLDWWGDSTLILEHFIVFTKGNFVNREIFFRENFLNLPFAKKYSANIFVVCHKRKFLPAKIMMIPTEIAKINSAKIPFRENFFLEGSHSYTL